MKGLEDLMQMLASRKKNTDKGWFSSLWQILELLLATLAAIGGLIEIKLLPFAFPMGTIIGVIAVIAAIIAIILLVALIIDLFHDLFSTEATSENDKKDD